MLELNGGEVLPYGLCLQVRDGSTYWPEVDWFFPIITDINYTKSSSLQSTIVRQNGFGPSEGQNPFDSIPVAYVSNHDQLLLFIDGEHRGEVWVKLWHMCDDEDFKDRWSHCYKVGNDFLDFLSKLQDPPEY